MKIRLNGMYKGRPRPETASVPDQPSPEPVRKGSWDEVIAKFGRELGGILHPDKPQQDDEKGPSNTDPS
jgi:hypothetical protein